MPPLPLTRGILSASGVGSGTRNLTLGSRSYQVRPCVAELDAVKVASLNRGANLALSGAPVAARNFLMISITSGIGMLRCAGRRSQPTRARTSAGQLPVRRPGRRLPRSSGLARKCALSFGTTELADGVRVLKRELQQRLGNRLGVLLGDLAQLLHRGGCVVVALVD